MWFKRPQPRSVTLWSDAPAPRRNGACVGRPWPGEGHTPRAGSPQMIHERRTFHAAGHAFKESINNRGLKKVSRIFWLEEFSLAGPLTPALQSLKLHKKKGPTPLSATFATSNLLHEVVAETSFDGSKLTGLS